MNSIIQSITRYFNRFADEMLDFAQSLDTTGWTVLMGILLVCGWFFLKGNKIRAA